MIALIGTAGRDKSKPMTANLWAAMVADALDRVPSGAALISGGAAWADHLAVELFLLGHASALRLHLPAPFATCDAFAGGYGTAGGAANFYHQTFSKTTGKMSVREIATEATACFAYTWGDGQEPTDGGTKNTWGQIKGNRVHVALGGLAA